MMDGTIYEARLRRVQSSVRALGLDGLIATKPQSVFYLSDFNPIIFSQPAIVVLPVNGPPTLLVWAVRFHHAKTEAMIQDIRMFGRWGDKLPLALDPNEALVAILNEKGLLNGALGVEEDHISANLFQEWRRLLPSASLCNASAAITRLRLVKDSEEIRRLRRASKLADTGMLAAIQSIKEGRSELEIAMRAEIAMRNAWMTEYPDHETAGFASGEGGIWTGLWCWVLSGPRMALEADTPKSRRIENGDLVLPQIWAISDGYTAENERTIGVGSISREARKVFDVIIAARGAAFQAIRSGVASASVYEKSTAVISQSGYGALLPGRIGHSIGLGPHEPFSLSATEDATLEAGMVLTIEPALSFPWGNVVHSDTILVTEFGYEQLTQTPNGVLLS